MFFYIFVLSCWLISAVLVVVVAAVALAVVGVVAEKDD